jgi:hypothetical protein
MKNSATPKNNSVRLSPMITPNSQPHSQSHLDSAPANPKARRKGIAVRNQAADLQRFAYDSAMALKESCTSKETGKVTMDVKTAVAVQKLIGAWGIASEHYRIARGKPLPGTLRPVPKPKKVKRSTEPEPVMPSHERDREASQLV